MKRILAIILALMMTAMFAGCGTGSDEQLSTPKADTFGAWKLTTDQEDTFEKVTLLTGTQGSYYQFNSKSGSLVLNATHYINGKKTESADIANFAVSGDGYLYIDYADSTELDYLADGSGESNVGTISISVTSDEGEDGTNLQFNTSGVGSSDSQMSLQNTDDTWDTSDEVPIKYAKAMDIWAINLGGGGDVEKTVSATKKAWEKKECVIITATFVDDEGESVKASKGSSEKASEEGIDESDSQYDNLTDEEIQAIEKEMKEADTEG